MSSNRYIAESQRQLLHVTVWYSTLAQFGLHAELQILGVVSGVDYAVEGGGGLVLESEGREEESFVSPFVLQASLEQVWQAVWRIQQVVD